MSEQTPEQPSTAPNPALQRQRASQLAQALRTELQKALIGQGAVIDDVLTALLAGGHVLVEGVPGLGKTLLVRALARRSDLRMDYRAAGAGLGQPLEQEPELLEQPEWAALSAAWWWSTHGLNDLADRGEFAAITRRINGGTNGQAERLALWERAKAVLS